MKNSKLIALIQEVVRECIMESKKPIDKDVPPGKLSKLNPDIAKKQGQKNMVPAPMPSPVKKMKESGLTSEDDNEAGPEYDEAEEVRLIKGLHLITKKLLKMHGVEDEVPTKPEDDADVDADVDADNVDENGGPQYKVVAPTQAEVSTDDKAKRNQCDPKVTENHKVQKRSQVAVKDGPQNPKNVRDPNVPMT